MGPLQEVKMCEELTVDVVGDIWLTFVKNEVFRFTNFVSCGRVTSCGRIFVNAARRASESVNNHFGPFGRRLMAE